MLRLLSLVSVCLFIAVEFNAGDGTMRMRYSFGLLTREERFQLECLLVQEMERQSWYSIVFLELWKTEGIITTQ